jgi:hypothetical protein
MHEKPGDVTAHVCRGIHAHGPPMHACIDCPVCRMFRCMSHAQTLCLVIHTIVSARPPAHPPHPSHLRSDHACETHDTVCDAREARRHDCPCMQVSTACTHAHARAHAQGQVPRNSWAGARQVPWDVPSDGFSMYLMYVACSNVVPRDSHHRLSTRPPRPPTPPLPPPFRPCEAHDVACDAWEVCTCTGARTCARQLLGRCQEGAGWLPGQVLGRC